MSEILVVELTMAIVAAAYVENVLISIENVTLLPEQKL